MKLQASYSAKRRRACAHLIALVSAAIAASGALAAPPRGARSVQDPVILVVGDSLSAEYGLAKGQGWVALLQERLAQNMPRASVINASVSGDTTAGGRARIASLLQRHRPTVVVLELGGNDALRGLPLQSTRANLQAMVEASKEAGARVLLLGMQVPPNYGGSYSREFAALFKDVARQNQIGVLPFFLAGIADAADPLGMFQTDRIHPSAQAQPRMLENVWPHLQPLLR